jgi:prepilin-type N-terminal cleavage/methylation domain-containing protein/prepilin-type processing-associated H-X9-DG protein
MRHSGHIVDMGRGNGRRIGRRSAFTLVELLVVITIIGMLTALLLPAVQSARESGRRATCNNSQHQLSLALQNFESSRRLFPGYINNVGNNPYALSWVVALFPYMDRRDVYDIWANGEANAAGTVLFPQPGLISAPIAAVVNSATAMTQDRVNVDAYKYLPIFICPSDPPESKNTGDTWCSYVVNRGLNGTTPRFAGPPDLPVLCTAAIAGTAAVVSVPSDSAENGVCMDQFVQLNAAGLQQNRPNTRVGLDYISNHDGSSTTLLLAESLLTSRSFFATSSITATPTAGSTLYLRDYQYTTGAGTAGGTPNVNCYFRPSSLWTSGGYNANLTGTWPVPTGVTTCIDQASLAATNVVTVTKQTSSLASPYTFHCEMDLGFEWGSFSATPRLNDKVRSRHSGGVVVSFCDGHQQFLSDSVNINVYKQLMTPWGAHAKDPSPDANGTLEGPLLGVLDEASY